ncbi:uncharacterized protein CTRU02_209331 [Colletotrichum truncatum]|uniref:Uncharacterized protein n=1 Tax=Colletotrichum truncatum TaxID=5467 RepID=A0ACC3YS61_COLTU|nr:uncharacterized protein CTRU02_08594 [Colletotrichum truncatum]KAF6789895.1 hypothetical protein CTRU02_08594 [Colletotrichum truncatum]
MENRSSSSSSRPRSHQGQRQRDALGRLHEGSQYVKMSGSGVCSEVPMGRSGYNRTRDRNDRNATTKGRSGYN